MYTFPSTSVVFIFQLHFYIETKALVQQFKRALVLIVRKNYVLTTFQSHLKLNFILEKLKFFAILKFLHYCI